MPKLKYDVEAAPPSLAQIEAQVRSCHLRFRIWVGISLAAISLLYLYWAEIGDLLIGHPQAGLLLIFGGFLPWLLYGGFQREYIRHNSPITKDFCEDLLKHCESDETCGRYRDAVLAQGREFVINEYAAIGFFATRHQYTSTAEERRNRAEAAHRALYRLSEPPPAPAASKQ